MEELGQPWQASWCTMCLHMGEWGFGTLCAACAHHLQVQVLSTYDRVPGALSLIPGINPT